MEILEWTFEQAISAMDTNGFSFLGWTIGGTNNNWANSWRR